MLTEQNLRDWAAAEERKRAAIAAYAEARAELGPLLRTFTVWLAELGYHRPRRNAPERNRPKLRERRAAFERILRRDGMLCRWCAIAPATQSHHLIPHAWGGPDADWNKVGLCETCHGSERPFSAFSVRAILQLGAEQIRRPGAASVR